MSVPSLSIEPSYDPLQVNVVFSTGSHTARAYTTGTIKLGTESRPSYSYTAFQALPITLVMKGAKRY